ncbi:EAL domain-containing protein [Vibrio salinus]|uniref:EAL domain-containing protein n=1 Tax=Vibrio salinus TaxID=2899784 RepID=UPI001E2AC7FA|nr:EAL domain-containing protein [Vibrio salinus]MCE0495531.1 EAL domain-containing protein [Vibrio salinus]
MAELFIDSGLNTKEYDLFDTPGIGFSMSGEGSKQKKLNSAVRPIILHCDIRAETKSKCGIQFHLPYDAQEASYVSLAPYHRMFLDAKAYSSNPGFDNRIRVTVKTTSGLKVDNENTQADTRQIKSQSVRLRAGNDHSISMNDFKVDSWWIDKFGRSLKDTEVDFTKVLSIEVLANEVPVRNYGQYTVEVRELKFQGKVIPQALLWYSMSVLFPVLILGCFAHAIWFCRRSDRRLNQKVSTDDTLYLDAETHFFNKNGLIKDYEKIIEEDNTSNLYYFRLNNYEQLKKILGPTAALMVLNKHWQFLTQRWDDTPIVIYRLGESEFVVNSVKCKLSENEVNYALIRPENDSFIIDKTIVYIPKHYQTPTIEQFIERCQVTAQYCREHQEHYAEFSLGHFHKHEEEIYIRQCLRTVLGANEFYLVYLPYYNSNTGKIVGAEALLRCSAPTLYRYSPEVYVKVAEQHGLIRNIDLWVINQAFVTLKQYQDKLDDDFMLSINISPRQMLDHTFVDELRKLLLQHKVDPSLICLELKETFFVNIEELESTNLVEIKKLGFSIGLDNFGTGYTAFTNLTHIPADQIKIDHSYVNSLSDKTMTVVVSSLINIAKAYNYELAAEGIETREQMDTLIVMGCEVFQGFYISDPISFEQLLDFDTEQVKNKG